MGEEGGGGEKGEREGGLEGRGGGARDSRKSGPRLDFLQREKTYFFVGERGENELRIINQKKKKKKPKKGGWGH